MQLGGSEGTFFFSDVTILSRNYLNRTSIINDQLGRRVRVQDRIIGLFYRGVVLR